MLAHDHMVRPLPNLELHIPLSVWRCRPAVLGGAILRPIGQPGVTETSGERGLGGRVGAAGVGVVATDLHETLEPVLGAEPSATGPLLRSIHHDFGTLHLQQLKEVVSGRRLAQEVQKEEVARYGQRTDDRHHLDEDGGDSELLETMVCVGDLLHGVDGAGRAESCQSHKQTVQREVQRVESATGVRPCPEMDEEKYKHDEEDSPGALPQGCEGEEKNDEQSLEENDSGPAASGVLEHLGDALNRTPLEVGRVDHAANPEREKGGISP
mmetsp:Transcript_41016/g.95812  ORF Transcript_41016/g.95812 Transcript_41016/m.95812 type:complete len:268 (+) Transcript_41016:145-948(+)